MTKLFILLTFCFISLKSHAQTYIYDGQGNIINGTHMQLRNKGMVSLFDSLTGNKFILDTTHIIISAFNSKDSLLWKTDPWKDNKLEEYRTQRPIISYFKFITEYWCYDESMKKGTKTIAISYNNTQFGFIELSNGKFHFCGQD